MYKPAAIAGTLFALLAVILGAFGAHYLKSLFEPALLQSFETGVRYQFYHALALLFLSTAPFPSPLERKQWVFRFFVFGMLLFSGSIYALCFLKATQHIGLGGLGILTPVGGLLMITGWGLWFYSLFSEKS